MSRRQLHNVVSIQNTSTILQCVLSIRPLIGVYPVHVWRGDPEKIRVMVDIFNVSPGQCDGKDILVKSIFEELVFLYVKYVM